MDRTLNDFQTQLAESFHSKINLLEKIIGDKHWLTTGGFKEKVLISFLNDNLPKKLKAKSGFVVFPTKRRFNTEMPPEDYDSLNRSSYIMSKQIDILVYDVFESSPVFEDDNIVLLSPESVKAVIEVKGTLNGKHLTDSIGLLMDYRNKWIEYKAFSKEHHIAVELKVPALLVYAWEFKRSTNGSRQLTGVTIRKKLSNILKENSTFENYRDTPFISSVFIYKECETTLTVGGDLEELRVGYFTTRGRSTKFLSDGTLQEGGDKTLFGLLRTILAMSDCLNNRFLTDTDDTSRYDLYPHQDTGFSESLKKVIINKKVIL
jgi:hypothetical protein